jgi:glutamate N-acetyltransferase/amino-acid N-acetyltransferase
VGEVTVGGVVKGAGMIEPSMATMLAFLTTDLSVTNSELQSILADAVNESFNRITIDGDMSTNDTVLIIANGNSGIHLHKESKKFQESFAEAVKAVCAALAKKCVSDGEKVTKFIRMKVTGAKTSKTAEKVARCIANSLLVKSSWFGSDPNWGRIIDAAGYAKVGINFDQIDLDYNEVPALKKGEPIVGNKGQWKEIVSAREFTITLNLNQGKASGEIWTNDLSEEYVNFNKSE